MNASGFLLQLTIEERVRAVSDHRWIVVSREHPWRKPDSQSEGFIDLILQRDNGRMVIECKRARQAAWVFLVPEELASPVVRARWLWADGRPGLRNVSGWSDLEAIPDSPESSFCVITRDPDSSMLERIAGALATSMECLAAEELALARDASEPFLRIYAGVIVTTAALYTCRHLSASISLRTGELDEATFTSVPAVRFRKSLPTALRALTPRTLGQASEEAERTIFVVNAESFLAFLRIVSIGDSTDPATLPWNRARAVEAR